MQFELLEFLIRLDGTALFWSSSTFLGTSNISQKLFTVNALTKRLYLQGWEIGLSGIATIKSATIVLLIFL